MALQWDLPRPDAAGTTHLKERLELVMGYRVTAREPNGTTRLRATCKSVNVTRTRVSGLADTRPDAVEALQGRSFTFAVDPNGRLTDRASLAALIQEIAAESFRTDVGQGRIKAPDMVWDVVTTQFCLWDAAPPRADVTVGDQWTSRLPVPTPWVSRKAREVHYRFDRVEALPSGAVAVITSTHTLSSERAPRIWPIPYSGRMRQSGTFGFLMGHKIHRLDGTGIDRFDLSAGRFESYEHRYRLESQAFMPLNMSHPVQIRIDQTLSMAPCAAVALEKER
jgi:hypothetical protein